MEKQIEVPIYKPNPGDRVRLALHYAGTWRVVFWLKVSKDGSIYLGPRYDEITTYRRGAKTAEGGKLAILYGEGEEVIDPALRRTAKLSFHATGIINVGDKREYRDAIRNLKDQQLLCGMVFQHPTAYGIATEPKKRDICLRYPIDEKRPVVGFAYVAPVRKVKLVEQPSLSHQINLLLRYADLSDAPDMVLQIVIGHGPRGPWPPVSVVYFPTAKS